MQQEQTFYLSSEIWIWKSKKQEAGQPRPVDREDVITVLLSPHLEPLMIAMRFI